VRRDDLCRGRLIPEEAQRPNSQLFAAAEGADDAGDAVFVIENRDGYGIHARHQIARHAGRRLASLFPRQQQVQPPASLQQALGAVSNGARSSRVLFFAARLLPEMNSRSQNPYLSL
jgi:hypothetical protein